jgi:hypothetical protein
VTCSFRSWYCSEFVSRLTKKLWKGVTVASCGDTAAVCLVTQNTFVIVIIRIYRDASDGGEPRCNNTYTVSSNWIILSLSHRSGTARCRRQNEWVWGDEQQSSDGRMNVCEEMSNSHLTAEWMGVRRWATVIWRQNECVWGDEQQSSSSGRANRRSR